MSDTSDLRKRHILMNMLNHEFAWAVKEENLDYARALQQERLRAKADRLTERERNRDGSEKPWQAPANQPIEPESVIERLFLVCTECGEAFSDMIAAKDHEEKNCSYEYDEEGGSYLIRPESQAF